jgi:hypothetical protein
MDIMAVLSFSELKAHFIRSPYLMPEILIFRPDLVDYPVQLGYASITSSITAFLHLLCLHLTAACATLNARVKS